MDKRNAKKYLIILILKLLENETDKEHVMTQKQISSTISEVYPCERKTVGRNIKFLQSIGYPIVKTPKGVYLDQKKFVLSDREFIKYAIITADKRTMEEKEKLLADLIPLINKNLRRQ